MLAIPKGNLIRNPGFELGLEFWEHSNVSAAGAFSHSGLSAALLGSRSPDSVSFVYQDVPVCAGSAYELSFHLAGLEERSVRFAAEVRWLDEYGADLGLALALSVFTVPTADRRQWALHTGISEASPPAARKARVSFTAIKAPVLLDDVLFYATD